MSQIGFIGYGEVGYQFSLGFKQKGLKMVAYAPIPPNPETVKEKAKSATVKLVSQEELASTSEIIFSCVWPSGALAVASEFAKLLHPGQFYLDVNSISPATTEKIAKLIVPTGADFVKFSIMYAVPLHGVKVPILAGGAKAAAIAPRLNDYGMNIRVIGTDPKATAAIKILRAACLKGIVALLFETLLAAQKYGLRDQTLEYIAETFTDPFAKTADAWISSTAIHAKRRAGEMDEAIEALTDVGITPEMAQATKRIHERIAAKNLTQKFGGEWAPSYREVLDAMLQTK